METYKQEFIDFMLESKVLKFGDFTLKSGRKSPLPCLDKCGNFQRGWKIYRDLLHDPGTGGTAAIE